MLHLSLAVERQKEWVITVEKKKGPFQGSCLQASQAYTSSIWHLYLKQQSEFFESYNYFFKFGRRIRSRILKSDSI